MFFYRWSTCSLSQVKYLMLNKAELSLQFFPMFEVLIKYSPHTPRHLPETHSRGFTIFEASLWNLANPLKSSWTHNVLINHIYNRKTKKREIRLLPVPPSMVQANKFQLLKKTPNTTPHSVWILSNTPLSEKAPLFQQPLCCTTQSVLLPDFTCPWSGWLRNQKESWSLKTLNI